MTLSSFPHSFHTSHANPFYTKDHRHTQDASRPGSVAFGECEINALSDLFLQFAHASNSVDDVGPYLDQERIKQLLESVGEKPDDATLQTLMERVNQHKDGKLRLSAVETALVIVDLRPELCTVLAIRELGLVPTDW